MNQPPSPLERGASFVCLAAAAALAALPLANPDIFWHLSAGAWAAAHRAVPSADWLSHTKPGAPWSDFEWAPQLLYHGALGAGGLPALWALKMAALAASAAVLWRLLAVLGAGPLGRGLGVLVWMLASPAANDLRPENFSLLAFLILLLRLECARLVGRAEATRAELLAGAALFALWGNVHAGFVYGLGLLGLYGAAAAFRGRTARALLPAVVGAASVLVNPYGVGVWTVPWEHYAARAELQAYIVEWQAASVLSPWLAPLWSLMAISFAALALRRAKTGAVPLEHVGLLTALAWSAASHVRTSPYFAAAAVGVTAACAGAALEDRPRRWLGLGAAAAATAFLLALYGPVLARSPLAFDPRYVPARATRFLEAEASAFSGKRLFNPWHWGGYLGWRLGGAVPVFADGRYIFHDLLGPMHEAMRSPEALAALLDARGVELAVVERRKQFAEMPVTHKDGGTETLSRPLYLFFFPREAWALVHWDDRALVFARRSAFGKDWLREREFRWFRPDDLRAAELEVTEGHASFAAVAAEANRWGAGAEAYERDAQRLWLADLARAR